MNGDKKPQFESSGWQIRRNEIIPLVRSQFSLAILSIDLRMFFINSGLVRLSQSQKVMPMYFAVFFQLPLWSFLSEKI